MLISDWSSDVCSSDLPNIELSRSTLHRRIRDYPTIENVRASLSLRRDPRLGEHILPIILHRAVIICAHLPPPVKAVPHLVPVPPRRGLAVFRCAGFEEIGVLNTVQLRREPRPRVLVDQIGC